MRHMDTNKQHANITSKGFTIVELLIVIFVIGILAAIVIVAFTGIQDRAKATKVTSIVNQYNKALALYLADNATYPISAEGCLGDSYPSDQCWSGPSGIRSENSTLNNAIRPYMNNMDPLPSPDLYPYVGNQRGGVLFSYSAARTLDGGPAGSLPYILIYYLKADRCSVGKALSKSASINYSTTNPNPYTEYNGGIVQCEIALPTP